MVWLLHSLDSLSRAPVAVVFAAALIACIWDVRTRRIPNWLTLPLLATGLSWCAWQHGIPGLVGSFLAALILSLPYFLLFVFAGGGGGDVKIMAGIGAWAGLPAALPILMAVALSGVVLGILFALARRQVREVMSRVSVVAQRALPTTAGGSAASAANVAISGDQGIRELQPIPYGVAVFAGVSLVTGVILLWRV